MNFDVGFVFCKYELEFVDLVLFNYFENRWVFWNDGVDRDFWEVLEVVIKELILCYRDVDRYCMVCWFKYEVGNNIFIGVSFIYRLFVGFFCYDLFFLVVCDGDKVVVCIYFVFELFLLNCYVFSFFSCDGFGCLSCCLLVKFWCWLIVNIDWV